MIRAIIIDDAVKAVNYVRDLLGDLFPQIDLAGTANTVDDAVNLFKAKRPELVFLDIEIGNKTGFDFLNEIDLQNTRVIFISGHDEFALKAFKYNAVHYLVKPFDVDEFKNAVERVLEEKKGNNILNDIKSVIAHIDQQRTKKLAVSTEEGIKYIQPSDILYIQADGSYSKITLIDNTSILVSKLLKEFEKTLSDTQFYRIRKSFLINFNYVKMVKRQDGGVIEMEDGQLISIPRRKRDDFLLRMTDFTH